jgi:cytochrome P450
MIRSAQAEPAGHLPRVKTALPFLGAVPRLWREPARGLVDLQERYGPVFDLDLLGRGVFAIGPEANAYVLRKRADAFSAAYDKPAPSLILGKPVIFQDGAVHRRMRSLMHAPLKGAGLASVAPLIAEVVREQVRRWEQVPLLEATRVLTLSVILRAGMSIGDQADARRMEHLFSRMLFGLVLPWRFPGSPLSRGLAARREIDALLTARIGEARRESGESRGDVLSLLARAADGEGNRLSDAEVLDNVRVLVLAGHETTASVLAWVLIHLAADGDLWHSVCAEVGPEAPLPLSLQDLRALPRVQAVVHEALRRYTPLWSIRRTVVADDVELYGHPLPRGTVVHVSPLATQHLPAYWREPFRFDAGRWLDGAQPAPDTWLPFGTGDHICLGMAFALLEIVQVVVLLAAERRRPVLAGEYDLRPVLLPLIHPDRRIRLRFDAS